MGVRKKRTSEERDFDLLVGALICEARRAADIQQKDLAQRVGISRQLLYQFEVGIRSCSPFVLSKIAAALDIEVANLVP